MEYNRLIYSKSGKYYGFGNSSNFKNYGNGVIEGVKAECDFVIPKRINGILVKEILLWAFRECTKIKSVKIEAPIKIISSGAFYHCISLESIIIPKTVETIETTALSMYSGFIKVNRTMRFLIIFEKGTRIKQIKEKAIEYQTGLTMILPVYSLPKIASNAFIGSTGEINIYAYKRDLNISGILTKQISKTESRVNTCNYKRSQMSYSIILYIIIVNSKNLFSR